MQYEDWVKLNRIKVNRYLNIVLWIGILAGPAVAMGVRTGWFHAVSYETCILLSVSMLLLALAHLLMVKKWPEKRVTSCLALFAVNIILVYVNSFRVGIRITWFLVPLLSLMFCDARIYVFASVFNYFMMALGTWSLSTFYAGIRMDFDRGMDFFVSYASGYTVELIFMTLAGWRVGKLTITYFRELLDKFRKSEEREAKIQEQMKILDSMAGIYENVNLIDFVKMTEMSVRNQTGEWYPIDLSVQMQTRMNQKINLSVIEDQEDAFRTFTNLTTLKARLNGKKTIYAEFLNRETGWFRAQYIVVESDEKGVPQRIIYTTQDIDAEKRREKHLLQISMTDGLTRLLNRRSYEEEVTLIGNSPLPEDLVIFSVDINGLKIINDSLGHAAGDELIIGAAKCLCSIADYSGKVFRVGGDEFIAIMYTPDAEAVKQRLLKQTSAWHGTYQDTLSLAVGWAAVRDFPQITYAELERQADSRMYVEKEKHYMQLGQDRKGQPTAFSALCSDCEKIVKGNLLTDSFNPIKMSSAAKRVEFGRGISFSQSLEDWVKEGMVHPDDVEAFQKKMNIENIRHVFESGKQKMNFFYRRKKGDGFRKVLIEIVEDGAYTEENQRFYLSVKDVEE